jgi:hypothetical protein
MRIPRPFGRGEIPEQIAPRPDRKLAVDGLGAQVIVRTLNWSGGSDRGVTDVHAPAAVSQPFR